MPEDGARDLCYSRLFGKRRNEEKVKRERKQNSAVLWKGERRGLQAKRRVQIISCFPSIFLSASTAPIQPPAQEARAASDLLLASSRPLGNRRAWLWIMAHCSRQNGAWRANERRDPAPWRTARPPVDWRSSPHAKTAELPHACRMQITTKAIVSTGVWSRVISYRERIM